MVPSKVVQQPELCLQFGRGRFIVLCFFVSASDAKSLAAIDAALARKDLFDDKRASFFGVSIDPTDRSENRVADNVPGHRFFWDFDGTIGKLYGSVPQVAEPDKSPVPARRLRAGVGQAIIDDLAAGRRSKGLSSEEGAALDVVAELMSRHGVFDATYAKALRCFGEAGAVELTALIGYFVLVCWIMNVARTPGPAGSATPSLLACLA